MGMAQGFLSHQNIAWIDEVPFKGILLNKHCWYFIEGLYKPNMLINRETLTEKM